MTNKSIRDYINLIENLQREGVAEGTGQWIVKYWDKQPENTPAEDRFGSEEQARAFLAKLPAHYVKALRQERSVAEGSESDAYGNTGEKHECGSCDGTGIDTYNDECPECGGKGWVRDKEE